MLRTISILVWLEWSDHHRMYDRGDTSVHHDNNSKQREGGYDDLPIVGRVVGVRREAASATFVWELFAAVFRFAERVVVQAFIHAALLLMDALHRCSSVGTYALPFYINPSRRNSICTLTQHGRLNLGIF